MASTPSTTECLKNTRPKVNIYYKLLYYRVSIKSFPVYKHLLQENYME